MAGLQATSSETTTSGESWEIRAVIPINENGPLFIYDPEKLSLAENAFLTFLSLGQGKEGKAVVTSAEAFDTKALRQILDQYVIKDEGAFDVGIINSEKWKKARKAIISNKSSWEKYWKITVSDHDIIHHED